MAASVEVAQKWGGFFKPLVLQLWFPVILYLAGKYNHVQTRQHTRFMLDSTTVIKFMSVWNWNLQCLYTHHSLSPKENYHQALHPHLLDHLTVLKWGRYHFPECWSSISSVSSLSVKTLQWIDSLGEQHGWPEEKKNKDYAASKRFPTLINF